MANTQDLGYQAWSKVHHKQYTAAREGYKKETVQFAMEKLDVLSPTTDSVILELGAGTGMFTKVMADVLKDSTTRIIASDPNENMLQGFRESLPDIDCHQFPAQRIDLPDESVNAVVAANAFHWFADSKESFNEIHRVLAPGGKLGIVIYTLDHTIPWFAEIVDRFLQPLYRKKNSYFLGSALGKDNFLSQVNQSKKFNKLEGDSNFFPTEVEATYQSMYNFFSSLSVLIVADDATKLAFKTRFDDVMKKYFTDKQLQTVTYVSWIYWCEKKML